MESAFLLEKKLIAMTFNTEKETTFMLVSDTEKLDLTEENISSDVVIKRFKLLKQNDLNFISNNYKKLPKDTFEGYSIYYWGLNNKLFLSYPSGYILIYNAENGNLEHHFQAKGKNPYIVRNITGSPVQKSFFFSAESMRNIYHCNYESVLKGNAIYSKLILPKNVTVNDIKCHPNEKFIFIGCSDGLVRIFDYSNDKEKIVGLVDIPLDKNGLPQKNQHEIIKQNNILGITTLDINSYGNILLSGCENGYLYIWDALCAIKDKRLLLTKSRFSSTGLISSNFLKMKQFGNLDRLICLTKEGKVFICNIVIKGKHYSFNKLYENNIFQPIVYSLAKYNILTTNFISCSNISNLISIRWPNLRMDKIKNNEGKFEEYLLFLSYNCKFFFIYDNINPKINFPNASQLTYPNYLDLIASTELNSFNTNPNLPCNLVFEPYLYVCDNYYVYRYSIETGVTKSLINFTKKFNLKNIMVLKFEVRPKRKKLSPDTKIHLMVLIQNELHVKSILIIELNGNSDGNSVSFTKKFDDIIDFIPLGVEDDDLAYILFLHKNKQIVILFDVINQTTENKNIEGSINRMYGTPFTNGFCVVYRNVLNQLKFSENIGLSIFHKDNEFDNLNKSDSGKIGENTNIGQLDFSKTPDKSSIFENTVQVINKFSFKNSSKTALSLDFSEREIDLSFTCINNNKSRGKSDKFVYEFWCAISMIEKILICDKELAPIFQIKISLLENPNIISSLFWIGCTLIYTKANDVFYYYPNENIQNKIFTNDQTHMLVSGVLSDRFILINKIWDSKELKAFDVTTPAISPFEPIMIGYLDYGIDINYNIIKHAVLNMLTNQVSDYLINKFILMNMNEVASILANDSKSSFIDLITKLKLNNSLLDFGSNIDMFFPNLDLANKIKVEDLIWKLEYDQNYDELKKTIIQQQNILLNYGLFENAIQLLELIGDYPRTINLLLIAGKQEDFIKYLKLFSEKNKLSYSELILMVNTFIIDYSQQNNQNKLIDIMSFNSTFEENFKQNIKKTTKSDKNDIESLKELVYNKIFDNYKGDPFIYDFLDQDKKNIQNKICTNLDVLKNLKKKNSHVFDVGKKVLSFGEQSFSQFVYSFNAETKDFELISICNLQLQKIEHYYGYSNTINDKDNRK